MSSMYSEEDVLIKEIWKVNQWKVASIHLDHSVCECFGLCRMCCPFLVDRITKKLHRFGHTYEVNMSREICFLLTRIVEGEIGDLGTSTFIEMFPMNWLNNLHAIFCTAFVLTRCQILRFLKFGFADRNFTAICAQLSVVGDVLTQFGGSFSVLYVLCF